MARQYDIRRAVIPADGHDLKLVILQPKGGKRPPEKMPGILWIIGNREPFYCETMTYVENLRRAGVPACVDVYPTGFHAFDMLLPMRRISRQAIAAFERQFLYAAEHYRAAQSEGATGRIRAE